MSNSKKVQQDIDRLLRRTQDGVESYEELYNKFLKAGTQTQKERLEGELKKEIKKLQRFRDAIKALIANPEVKDTKMLETYQKNIEEKMEVFKTCERETKTKAFSKEGLAAHLPHDSPQAHTESWLKSAIDNVRKQIEIIEYDVERTTRGHHGRSKSGTLTENSRLQKLRFHLGNLEQLLKKVTNGEADLDEVAEIEERVQRLLRNEGNSGDDEEEEDEEEENLYSGFDLEDVHEKRRSGAAEEDDVVSASVISPAAAAATSSSAMSQEASKKTSAATANATATTSAAAGKAGVQSAGVVNTPTTAAAAATKKTLSVATVSKGEVGKRPTTTQPSPKAATNFPPMLGKMTQGRDAALERWDESAAGLLDDDMDKANADTFGDDAMDMAGPGSLAEMAKVTGNISRMGDWEKGRPASLTSPPATVTKNQVVEQPLTSAISPRSQQGQVPATAMTPVAAASSLSAQRSPEQKKPQSTTPAVVPMNSNPGTTPNVSASASVPVQSAVPAAAATTALDKATMLQLVDMSLANLPHTQDVDRQRPFEPSNPTVCPSYYPQKVLPALASPDIYREFEIETLFFIFYYHQNTYQQYYAAKQIKAQSFRYHTQLNTWFQRNGRLKETQEGGERGSFIYFNYEDTWRIEEKEDFMFNYHYLEDELR